MLNYILEIIDHHANFKNKNSFEEIVELTNDDFDNSELPLARHTENPYLLRSINYTFIEGKKHHCLGIYDYMENIWLSVIGNKVDLHKIDTRISEYLQESFGLVYDGFNPPQYNEIPPLSDYRLE